jgi:proline racemase
MSILYYLQTNELPQAVQHYEPKNADIKHFKVHFQHLQERLRQHLHSSLDAANSTASAAVATTINCAEEVAGMRDDASPTATTSSINRAPLAAGGGLCRSDTATSSGISVDKAADATQQQLVATSARAVAVQLLLTWAARQCYPVRA